MRLGLVAVMLLAACGPVPEDTTRSGTIPVRVGRWSPGAGPDDVTVPTDPLELHFRIWADGVSIADLHYRGTFEAWDAFDDLGRIEETNATVWRFQADFRDSTGQHSLDREAQLIGHPHFSSLVLCITEGDEVLSNVVMIDRSAAPPPGAALKRTKLAGSWPSYTLAGADDDETGPLLRQAGFGRMRSTFDVVGDGRTSHAYWHAMLEMHDDGVIVPRDDTELWPGIYQLQLIVPHSRWIAQNVLQHDSFVLTDDFAIGK